MKKDFLKPGVKVVLGVRVTNVLVHTAGWKAEEKTFKTHCRSGLVYWLVTKPFFVELDVAGRDAENSFSNYLAGLYGSSDLAREQAQSLQEL